jgi:hypothetical protein
MKNLKLILLLQALMLGALTLNADDDCCPDGSPFSVDCDGNGTPDACSTDDCAECSTSNPDPIAPNTDCCGGTGYDDGVDACCPNGNQVVPEITNGTISEWCDDCTYVKTYDEPNHCCDSEEGTFAYKTTLACACFDCIMNDCIGFNWGQFALQNCIAEPLNVCISLADASFQVISGNVDCSQSVCPDTACPAPAAQDPEDPMT